MTHLWRNTSCSPRTKEAVINHSGHYSKQIHELHINRTRAHSNKPVRKNFTGHTHTCRSHPPLLRCLRERECVQARTPARACVYACPVPNIINLPGMEGSFSSSPGLFQAVPLGFTGAKNTTCYNGVCHAEEVVMAWMLAW